MSKLTVGTVSVWLTKSTWHWTSRSWPDRSHMRYRHRGESWFTHHHGRQLWCCGYALGISWERKEAPSPLPSIQSAAAHERRWIEFTREYAAMDVS